MKKVLILAYYFPPLGLGGTQRAVKFVKYLPEFGWEPFVITVKDVAYYAKDPTLLDDLQNAKIFRTGSLDPQRLLAIFSYRKKESIVNQKTPFKRKWLILNKIVSSVFIPDSKVLWLPFAFIKALLIKKKENINCLLTTSPPHSIHLAGFFLKSLTNISWIADFRDGWSDGNFQKEPTRIHKWINRYLEKKVLKKADRVIGVSTKLVELFKNKIPEHTSKFYVITNGFDAEDVLNIKDIPSNEKFTITFCGAVTSISPVRSFLESLGRLIKKQPIFKDEIFVKIIGVDLEGLVEESICQFGLHEVVKCIGYLSHRDALQQIFQADLLLYPIARWARRDFIPGKTFEYLASGNLVLAIGPEVEGFLILKKANRVELVSHDNLEVIEHAILKYYHLFKQNLLPKGQYVDISKFERKQLTKKLAEILNNMF